MTRYCSNCGQSLSEDANFCEECGRSVRVVPAKPPEEKPVSSSPSWSAESFDVPAREEPWWYRNIVTIGVIAFAVIGFFWIMTKKGSGLAFGSFFCLVVFLLIGALLAWWIPIWWDKKRF